MNKKELTAAVCAAKEQTAAALQLVYDALNQGQRKKLLKEEPVKALLQLYEVVL